ncbi:MAG TPA: YCF48-related protein [Ignavibacteriaceae bacterium]|nr:YCF48-related protein [Ignavibacteriaceae bacterium]
MKKISIFFCLILYLSVSYPQEYTQWKWLQQRPQGLDLRWVHAFDNDTWYGCGMHGLFMKTTDRGQTWFHHAKASHPYSDGDYNMIYAAHFFNKNVGIVGGGDEMRRTTDGGVTWKEIPYVFVATGIIWSDAYFLNDHVGYVTGDNDVQVHRTSDAGLHWRRIDYPNPTNTFDIWVSSDEQTILLATLHGKIRRTTDAGATWSVIDVGVDQTLRKFAFKDNNNGWVVGYGGTAAYTNDAGATWTMANNGLPNSTFWDVDYRNYNGGLQVVLTGDPWYMYGTTNNGDTWTQISFRPSLSKQRWNDTYHATDFLPDGSFVTVGESGLINSVIGSDGPKCYTDWVKAGDIRDVWVQSPTGKIITVGAETSSGINDQIMISTNAGATWKIVNISSNTILRGISMADTSIGYTVGEGGAIYKTTNGGNSWSSKSSGVSANLYGVKFVNPNVGWAVGAGGTVIKTTDGGTTWNPQNSTIPASIYGVDFIDENTGWISGGSGNVRKTTNGGDTWINQNVSMAGSVNYTVKAVNSNIVFVGGTNKISKTIDGGSTWDTLTLPAQFGVNIYDMDFDDENYGVAGCGESKVLITTNGGATWKMEFANNFTVFGVDIVSSPTMKSTFLVGYNGTVLVSNISLVPVELASLTTNVQGRDITINWSTATEKNNQGFAIERKLNNGEFKEITFIEGKGTTTVVQNYSFVDKNLSQGLYTYRLKQVDYDGTAEYSSEVTAEIGSPTVFRLDQNFPNPFNPSTVIKYSIPIQQQVTVKVFDLLGNEVSTLVNEVKSAGNYEITWNAANYASGLYFYQIKAGNFSDIKKMILMK